MTDAVAVQVASLLRVQAPAAFEENVRSMAEKATSQHVASGLRAYLEAWKESQSAGSNK